MKLEADLHVHTIASGHAYSTIKEVIEKAKKKGLKLIALTEHGPSMPGAPHKYYFGNIRVVPTEYMGVKILRGVEANIIDFDGTLDLCEEYLKKLDWVAAGFHEHACLGGNKKKYTEALLKVIDNPLVDVIVHPGNPNFEIDHQKIVEYAKEKGVFLEINNSSHFVSRKGSYDNCLSIAKECARKNLMITVGSDAHWADDVGNCENAFEIINKAGIKKEQIFNLTVENIEKYLEEGKRSKLSII